MGPFHILLDEMGLDQMGLDKVGMHPLGTVFISIFNVGFKLQLK